MYSTTPRQGRAHNLKSFIVILHVLKASGSFFLPTVVIRHHPKLQLLLTSPLTYADSCRKLIKRDGSDFKGLIGQHHQNVTPFEPGHQEGYGKQRNWDISKRIRVKEKASNFGQKLETVNKKWQTRKYAPICNLSSITNRSL